MLGFAKLMRVVEILGGLGLIAYAFLYHAGTLWYGVGAAVLVVGLLGFCVLCPITGKCTLLGNKEK